MSEHARLSPSAASKWTACAGAVAAEFGRPDTAGEAAARGTAAHELLELGVDETIFGQKTRKPTMSNGVSMDMEDILAVRAAEKYLTTQNYDLFYQETRVPINEALERPDCWGTADHIGRHGDILEVTDYKHGSGILVDVEGNFQMLLYAIGAIAMPEFADCTTVKMTVIQPRIEHPDGVIRSCSISAVELDEWRVWFKEQADLTDDPNAPRSPGDKQCQWCRARGTCPELARYAMKRSLAVFDETTLEVTPESLLRSPKELSGDQIKTVLDNEKLISSWIKSVKEHALSGALAGNPPPEYKLVAGRKSKSLVNSEEDTEKKLRGMRKTDGKKLSKADVTVSTLLSPAKIIKQLKPLVTPKTFVNIEKMIVINDGSPTLVPITDNRPALPSKVDKAFENIPPKGAAEPDLSFLN